MPIGCPSDESESNDDPTSLSAVLALFMFFCGGLNDSCLISSYARKLLSSSPLPRVLRLVILSGVHGFALDEAMVPEFQETLRGLSVLVGDDIVLVLLTGLPNSGDGNPLKDEDRRCVLGDELGDEQLSSEDCRCICIQYCLCLRDAMVVILLLLSVLVGVVLFTLGCEVSSLCLDSPLRAGCFWTQTQSAMRKYQQQVRE